MPWRRASGEAERNDIFYDYYDKNVKQSNDYYIAVKFNLSIGQAKFGDSKEDKAAARFFSSLNREIEYYGSPDYMILGLAMQRLGFGFQEQSAGELLANFSNCYTYSSEELDFLTKCADKDISTECLKCQLDTILNLRQMVTQASDDSYSVPQQKK